MAALSQVSETDQTFRLRISGMDCGDCTRTIEKGISQLNGVQDVQVDFATEIMRGTGDVALEAVIAKLADLGYAVADDQNMPEVAVPEAHGLQGFVCFLLSQSANARAFYTALIVLATLPFLFIPVSPLVELGIDTLYIAVTTLVTFPLARKGLRNLVQAHRVTIDTLVTLAIIGAVFIGAYGEAVAVALLFVLGEALEGYSAQRSRESLRSLLALQPKEATVLRAHNSRRHDHSHYNHTHYRQEVVPVGQIALGDKVLVRPGEHIPVDGMISDGASSINQAPITGESIPVDRGLGDEVFAGTINGEGALQITVTRRAADSIIAQIARLVEQAKAQRSPTERFIDKFAAWYTPAVVAFAVLMLVTATFVMGQPFFDNGETRGWLYRSLALLIVACPCALVISIPVTVVSALTRLAQFGVLVKGGAQLTALSEVKVFAFDKTGTLTLGRPIVTGTSTVDCAHDPEDNEACDPCDDMVARAYSVESSSEHPLAHAVVHEARNRQVANRYPMASSVTAIAGGGIKGQLNGKMIRIGRHDLIHEDEATCEAARCTVASSGNNRAAMVVDQESDMIGHISVEDKARQHATEALQELRRLIPETHIVVLTGDRKEPSENLVKQLDCIDELRCEMRPADKMAAVDKLRQAHGKVAMIGDGINDAPSLASSDIGIAMGNIGTDQAMETADIILMHDNLKLLAAAVHISQRTKSILDQNIALSLLLKGAFLMLAVPGLATLWMAVVADVGATLLVTLNGMRLLRERTT